MAQIQIWTRNVNSTEFFFGNFTPQHTFLIKFNDDGTREILRGGPVDDSMLFGDVVIMSQEYNGSEQNDANRTPTLDWYNPSLPNTQNFQSQTIKTSSQSEIDTLWNSALAKTQEINSQLYDYEITSQNCNTVTYQLAKEMGLEDEVTQFISGKKLNTPGYADEFTPEVIERLEHAWTSFEEATEYMAKEYLNSLLTTATTIGTGTQFFLNAFSSAERAQVIQRVDPLTLDLDNDGVELIDVRTSTAFFDLDLKVTTAAEANDIKTNPSNPNYNPNATIYSVTNPGGSVTTYLGDGVKEQVGWIKADDGILTLDKNNNGTVDNILELFGKTNKTGTEELREYDLNNDGIINSSDAVFSQLKVWQDLNQNGISEASELKSLSDLSITSINVSPNSLTPSNQINNGNLVISEGSYLKSDGTTGTYANLDLAVNQSNSSSYTYTDSEGNVIGNYNLNLEVLSLPMIRGYGDVKALPIAASQDESLLNSLL